MIYPVRLFNLSLFKALAVGVLMAGGLNSAKAAEQATVPQARAADLLDCVIEPSMVVKLASPIVGIVSSVTVDRGDKVVRGQPLVKLEDAVEAANVDLARERATNDFVIKSQKARLSFLRSKQGRAEKLRVNAFVSEAALEEAQSDVNVSDQQVREAEHNYRVAQLELKRAEASLQQRTIVSPLDGVVMERLLVPGEYRNEQSPLMTLAQINPLRVEVLAPTSSYGRIRIGSKAHVYPEDPVGGSYEATVTVVDHVLDSASNTYGIRLDLPNSDQSLPGGLRCRIGFDQVSTSRGPEAASPVSQTNPSSEKTSSENPSP